MNDTTQFLIRHGMLFVFAGVLLEQLGLPLPAVPWLLAAGALATTGKFNLFLGLALTLVACLAADALWFYLGRLRGNQVLGWLCRISLEPDSCIRRTRNVFTRYGLRGVVFAKFLPGVSTVVPPMAGMSKVSAGRFFIFDGIGAVLYGGCFLLLGYAFSNQIGQIGAAISQIGASAFSLLIGFFTLYVAYKFWQRQRLLWELRSARITVAELREKLDAGEPPLIVDLRSSAELERDPSMIRGAVHLSLEDIKSRYHEFPHDREIVAYCSCPNEWTSARFALALHRKGFTRVRPLLGGIDAWRKQSYPIEIWKRAAANALVSTPANANAGTKNQSESLAA